MKQIYKIMVSIAILILISSIGMAANQGNNAPTRASENLTIDKNPTSDTPTISKDMSNLTPEEIEILKELIKERKYKEKSLSTKERMKKAKVPSDVINATIPPTEISTKTSADIMSLYDSLVYTNPISGITVQKTKFSNRIYTENYANWASWNFYLPDNSYVYIDISGNINHYDWGAQYLMIVDGTQYSTWTNNWGTCGYDLVCNQEVQRSELFYLNKGWHEVRLNGYAEFVDPDTYFDVIGTISVIAFPEYTAITVISPNGGENWPNGTTQTIKWKKYGNPGPNVKIELYKAGVLNSVISSKTPNDGSYSWYIPSFQPIGTDYKIKITSYEDSKYYDWSDKNFKIY